MAKRKNSREDRPHTELGDYRHKEARRKNNPPAKIAAEGAVPAIPKAACAYNPHLPPVLRFDASGAADKEGQYVVTMEGVDIYNSVDNTVAPTGADKVAAWFIDGDYDGRCFCITQAFFPDRGAWEKLARALNGKDGLIDAERFEALSGTTSLPFPAGKHKRVAVKVIDPRGNEVMSVERLGGRV